MKGEGFPVPGLASAQCSFTAQASDVQVVLRTATTVSATQLVCPTPALGIAPTTWQLSVLLNGASLAPSLYLPPTLREYDLGCVRRPNDGIDLVCPLA